MNDLNRKILEEFLIESFENLSCISEELTRYEKTPEDNELLNAIYRKVHTLKGSASFLGYRNLEKITHHTEDCLNKLQEGVLKINSKITDTLLESFDSCFSIVKEIEANGEEPEMDASSLIDNINKIGIKVFEPVIIADEKLNEDLLFSYEEKNKSVNEDHKSFFFDEEKASKTEITQSNNLSSVDSTIRVNINLLDKLMNVVGELVLNRNQIMQYIQVANDSELTRLGHQLNVITTELQTDIMSTRMQPVGSIFNKYERVVRDLANKQNKKISLQIIGGDTELDKSLLEVIKDPMTHLVRNAVDHGIESPEKRIQNDKSEEGQLVIKAYHEGGQVNIDIIDDGNGLSKEKILAKAISKGIISEEDSFRMSDQKVFNLIFAPGFSTVETVTNISGRGVGMDVVKTNIEKVSGKIEVISEPRKGSTFRLKIPLTLAIVPALIITAGIESFALPQKNLVELVLLKPGDDNKIEKIHDQDFYRLRGELIPVFYLNESLKIESEENKENDFVNIVFLNAEGNVYGLIVDDIRDTQEIVVKPLSSGVKTDNIFAGATLMGDGRVSLIIDALGFYNLFNNHQEKNKESEINIEHETEFKEESFELLLCQLKDKRLYGVPLCLVNRLEEFNLSDVVWSGDQALVKYRDNAMPLLNLEKSLKLAELSDLTISENKDELIINIIVVDIGVRQVGLVVDEILDIANLNSKVDEQNVDRNGLMGTIFANDKLVSVIDIHKIVASENKIDAQSENYDFSNCKFLVVDDSAFYRKIICDLITNCHGQVSSFSDGSDAIKEFEKNTSDYNFIITDIEMPRMNGDEFADKVRTLNSEIPILAVSTLSNGIHETKSFNSRIKKFDQKQFLNIVSNLINRED